MNPLVSLLLAQTSDRPAADAIIPAHGPPVTYADLALGSAQRARAYRDAGIGPGDVVLVARSVTPELYETLIALFRLGAVALFPEPAAGLAGLQHAIAVARPKAVATTQVARWFAPFVPGLTDLPLLPEPDRGERIIGDGPLAAGSDQTRALITFTSGSTGRPKGIVRSAAFLLLQHRLIEHLRRSEAGMIDLISLPVFILSNLAAGATSVIPRGPLRKPAALRPSTLAQQIRTHGVTRMAAPPAVCAQLLRAAKPPTLERVFTGGGPVFPNLLQGLQALTPQGEVFAVYGSTEAEPIAHLAASEVSSRDWTTMAEGGGLLAGRPIPEISIALIEDEIQVAGDHVNRGYLDPVDDAQTKIWRDGVLWHRTGDAGRVDQEGRLWLLGRCAARSGALFPFVVETAAMSWPGVRSAAFLAAPSGGVLAIVGDPGHQAAWARSAAALGPIKVQRVRRLPMDARHNSKVDYPRLKRALARSGERS